MFTLFSCNRQTDFEKMLIGSKWVLHEGKTLEKELDKWPNSYYLFKNDGTIKDFFMYPDGDVENMNVNADGSEIIDHLIWNYNSDNKELSIDVHKLKVISVEGDTIRLLLGTTNIMLYNIDKTYDKLRKGPGRCLGG